MQVAPLDPESPPRWCESATAGYYAELEHPADLFLEIRGHGPADLVERALFALFDQITDLRAVSPAHRRTFSVREPSPALALRRTLAEALSLFNSEGFLAAGARVRWEQTGDAVGVTTALWGENLDRSRHALQARTISA